MLNVQCFDVQCLIAGGSFVIFSCPSVLAQSNIVPDNTLGNESSVVNVSPDNPLLDLITGGAQRGQNLFHSFEQFNVTEGRGAYFTSPSADIVNILSRVTGNNSSEIFGTLGTNGASQPNLFLINPNGIIFGQNASLDVGGSFVATTADSIKFGDRGFFSASNPEVPPLLTVQPSAFFFNQMNDGIITNSSKVGLQLLNAQSLLLLGREINFDGGLILAFDGKIGLGAVAGEGEVELNITDDNLSFTIPETLARGNISLSNGAIIDLFIAGGGSQVQIDAKNFELTSRSRIFGNIFFDSNQEQAKKGNIIINAAENITFDDGSIFTIVDENGAGELLGNIELNATNITFVNGGNINIANIGKGNTGNISLIATENITFDGIQDASKSGINVSIISQEAGATGNIELTAENLQLTNGASIVSQVAGQANSGDINIVAEKVAIDGESEPIVVEDGSFSLPLSSLIASEIQLNGVGNAGDINIDTKDLAITRGGEISANSFGTGNAGDININAENIILKERGENVTGEINGEKFTISATNVIQSQINSLGFDSDRITKAQGKSGDININTNFLSLFNGSRITADTNGTGDGGEIRINAQNDVLLDGITPQGIRTGISADVGFDGIGNGGSIEINAKNFSILNNAFLGTSSVQAGNAGNITVTVKDNFQADGSLILSNVGNSQEIVAEGNVGRIIIKAKNIEFDNTAQIQAGLFKNAKGESGDVSLNATESIFLAGENTGIFTNVEEQAVGDGSNVQMSGKSISFIDGAVIEAGNKGQGSGGNITIDTDNLSLDRSTVNAATASGNGGNIDLQITEDLTLSNTSTISAKAENNANGGNLDIDTRFIIAFPNQNNDIIANASQGKGGDIKITAESIFGLEERPLDNLTNDINASSEVGLDGDISINTPDTDPLRGLDNLPNNIIDASTQMVSSCLTAEEAKSNKFFLTGRGGIPNNPTESVVGDATLSAEWLTLTETATQLSEGSTTIEHYQPTEIVEAKGWIIKPDGTVVLTAAANSADNLPWGFIPSDCQNSEQ